MINLRVLSVAVAVALGMLAAVQLASPESLGISTVAARWLGILAAGLGILQGFLPKVQGPTTDPAVLAERIVKLSPAERAALIEEVEHRSLDERIGRPPPPAPPCSDLNVSVRP